MYRKNDCTTPGSGICGGVDISKIQFYIKIILYMYDGQGAFWQDILYADRACFNKR